MSQDIENVALTKEILERRRKSLIYTKRYRRKKKKLGLCEQCGRTPISGPKRTTCEECSVVRRKRRNIQTWYTELKAKSRKRNIPFSLTYDDFLRIRKDARCVYGGEILIHGASLDRRNTTQGYEMDNIVPCCLKHNMMKGPWFSFDEMMEIMNLFPHLKTCGHQRLRIWN